MRILHSMAAEMIHGKRGTAILEWKNKVFGAVIQGELAEMLLGHSPVIFACMYTMMMLDYIKGEAV